jgi:hypothetical protein
MHSGGHRGSPVGFGRETFTRTKDPTMTDEMMSLRTLLEKSSDPDFLREMFGFAAQRLLELEVENLTGAAHGKRRPNQRVGPLGLRQSGRPFRRPAPSPKFETVRRRRAAHRG